MEPLLNFKTAYGQKLESQLLIDEISQFILAEQDIEKKSRLSFNPQRERAQLGFNYRILVGTDSEVSENYIDFVTAIVVHRIGQGARYFWRRQVVDKDLDLHRRLWQEALFSLDVSQKLLKLLTDIKSHFRFELHLDLGTNGKSQSVVKEITTMIRSYGMDVKLKPESYAASKIADRLI